MTQKTLKYSNWWAGPEERRPALNTDLQVEVAIIGGGFTGMHTALNLAEYGVESVIIERDFAGSGASGRNSGYIDGLIGKDYPSLLKVNSLSRAHDLCQFAKAAVRHLEEFIRKHEIDCDYTGAGNINAAVHPRQIKRLQDLKEAGKGLELDFEYLDQDAMRERGLPEAFIAGILDPVGGTLNPGKLVKALRELVIRKGITLYEGTEVLNIRNGSPAIIETPNGVIKAKKVVLATNAYTPQLGWKKRFLSPIWAGMLESAPLTESQVERLKWPGKEGIYTAHEKLESYRLTAHNTLIAGGKRIVIPYGFNLQDQQQPEMATAIEKVFRQRFPDLADLEMPHFWGGWIGIPLDFMPTVGVTGKNENIYYGIGYAGHGVPQTHLIGELLASRVANRAHPLGHILDRRTLPIPPEPLKWLASQAVDKFLGFLDRRTDRLLEKQTP